MTKNKLLFKTLPRIKNINKNFNLLNISNLCSWGIEWVTASFNNLTFKISEGLEINVEKNNLIILIKVSLGNNYKVYENNLLKSSFDMLLKNSFLKINFIIKPNIHLIWFFNFCNIVIV